MTVDVEVLDLQYKAVILLCSAPPNTDPFCSSLQTGLRPNVTRTGSARSGNVEPVAMCVLESFTFTLLLTHLF